MKFGFIPTEGGTFFQEALEEAVLGEELGFDSVWLEEHHSIRNHYWPSPLMALAGIATRTSYIQLGTDIAVLPFYHPVRAAEDIALLDIMSNGRLIFGAAIGYRPPEFELYGISLDERGTRYVEMLKIMRGLWSEERVEFHGKYFNVVGAIEPKPTRVPPLWLGGWGELSLKRAAQLGDAVDRDHGVGPLAAEVDLDHQVGAAIDELRARTLREQRERRIEVARDIHPHGARL